MNWMTLCLVALLLPLLWRYSVVCTSESDYYTARFPSDRNYTYNTARSSNRSSWNKTRAAQEILDAHNDARRELSLPSLERSPQLERYAREHAQLCGNNSEPDPFSVLPRLEGMSLVVNLWVNVDPSMTYTFTQVADHFYSEVAKEDYSDRRVPTNLDDRYHELYAYLQIIQPDLSRLGCYGERCGPIRNQLIIPPNVYDSIHYLHWTYLVCYYDNRTKPESELIMSAVGTTPLPLPSPSSSMLSSNQRHSGFSLPSQTGSLQTASLSPPVSSSRFPLPSPSKTLQRPSVLRLPLLPSQSLSSPNVPLPTLLVPSMSVSQPIRPYVFPVQWSNTLVPPPSQNSMSPFSSMLSLRSSSVHVSPLPSKFPLPTASPLRNLSVSNPSLSPTSTLPLPTPSMSHQISSSSLLLSVQPTSKTLVVDAALLSDHANCSSSFLMLPLLSILFSLFLILCLILALILFTLWIRQHKRAFLQTTDKGKQRVKFHCNTDVSGEHSQATHDNRNTYEPPACINGSSVLYESVYLQTFFDESSVEDNLTTVVTSLSYPITSSEQWIILDDQSCHMIHENTYATPLDPNKAELQQQQHSFELEDSSGTVSGIQSCDGKYL